VIVLRPLEPADYARLAEIDAAIDPGDRRDAEWYRERDAIWSPSLLRHRLVAERGGLVMAWGELAHGWWAYHPRKFHLRLNVDPRFQREGVGSRLYSALVEHVVSNWNPLQISAVASEARPWSIAFLEHRGFQEAQRRWDATLSVDRARLDRLSSATSDVAAQGVRILSLGELRQQRGGSFDHDLYVFEQRLYRDEPGYDPDGSLQFDQFMAFELNPKTAVDDGSFLALDGARMVGISRLRRDRRGAGVLHVGFTGVDPEYRGRGIAVALKLRTLEYAHRHGFAEIRTENDSTNAAMLHINLELGFELEPASIVLHRSYAVQT
jgi:mycothiol synthase